MSREVKIAGEGLDWDLKNHQVESMRQDAKAADVAQRVQDRQQTAPLEAAQQKAASHLPANFRPSVQTEHVNNKTPVVHPSAGAATVQQTEKDPRAATPERAAQVAQANTAFLGARDAATSLKNLGAPKVEAPKAELSPHGAASTTATTRAVVGKTDPTGTEVKQFNPGTGKAPPVVPSSVKSNLQRVVRERAEQHHVADETPQHVELQSTEQSVAANGAVVQKTPAPRLSAADRKKSEKKEDKEEARTGKSTPQTQTAKANKDLGGLQTGVGSESGSESQEFGHVVEMLAEKMAVAFPAEAASLQVFAVDAINAQGELAASYLHKAQQLKHEVIKDLGTRLSRVANENAALDAALKPLRERAEGLKTSDFLSDVNGIGILG